MDNGFIPQERAVWGALLAGHSRLMRLIEDDLAARCRLTHVEFEVLLRLAFRPTGARVNELARDSIITRSGVSRAVARLQAAGLVRRREDPTDGRALTVELTPAGVRAFHKAAEGHIALVRREFLSLYSTSELAQLGELLSRRRVDAAPTVRRRRAR